MSRAGGWWRFFRLYHHSIFIVITLDALVPGCTPSAHISLFPGPAPALALTAGTPQRKRAPGVGHSTLRSAGLRVRHAHAPISGHSLHQSSGIGSSHLAVGSLARCRTGVGRGSFRIGEGTLFHSALLTPPHTPPRYAGHVVYFHSIVNIPFIPWVAICFFSIPVQIFWPGRTQVLR